MFKTTASGLFSRLVIIVSFVFSGSLCRTPIPSKFTTCDWARWPCTRKNYRKSETLIESFGVVVTGRLEGDTCFRGDPTLVSDMDATHHANQRWGYHTCMIGGSVIHNGVWEISRIRTITILRFWCISRHVIVGQTHFLHMGITQIIAPDIVWYSITQIYIKCMSIKKRVVAFEAAPPVT